MWNINTQIIKSTKSDLCLFIMLIKGFHKIPWFVFFFEMGGGVSSIDSIDVPQAPGRDGFGEEYFGVCEEFTTSMSPSKTGLLQWWEVSENIILKYIYTEVLR